MKTILQRARNFILIMFSVVSEATTDQRRLLVWITAVAMFGALARGGVISFLALFINLMAAGHVFDYRGYQLKVGQNLPSLLILAIVVLACLVFSAWAMYESRAKARLIARRFHETCSVQALELLSECPRIGDRSLPMDLRRMQNNVLRNTRHVSNAAESMIRAIPSVMNMIVALAIAAWLNLLLTVSIMLLACFAIPVIYRQSLKIQENAKVFYNESIFRIAGFVRNLITNIDQMSYPLGGDRNYRSIFRKTDEVQEFFHALDYNTLATDRLVFATGLLRAIFFAVALIVFGGMYISQEQTPGAIIAYLVALNMVFNGFQQLSGTLATLLRFQPQVAEFRHVNAHLVRVAARIRKRPVVDTAQPIVVRCEGTIEGSVVELVLEPGGPTSFIHPDRITRTTLTTLLAPLEAATETTAAWLDVGVFFFDEKNLGEGLLETIGRIDRTAIEKQLAGLGRDEDAAALRDLPDNNPKRMLTDASPLVRAMLIISAIAECPATVAMIESQFLRAVEVELLLGVLEPLSDRIVLLTANRASGVLRGIQQAIVADREHILGMGDARWIAEQDLDWLKDVPPIGGAMVDDLLFG